MGKSENMEEWKFIWEKKKNLRWQEEKTPSQNQSSEDMKVRVFNELEKITDSIYIWIYFSFVFARFET